jgi:phospho-N-acetylmuramoyl-pentapeptide-transferase
MLAWLLNNFGSDVALFNVFRYITFRSGMAALTSFLIVLLFGNSFIALMRSKQFGQAIRDDGPQSHLKKRGTPTMGGVLIVFGLSVSTLLWGNLGNAFVWACLLVTWAFALVGFLDDYFKVIRKDPKGLASRWKMRLMWFSALAVALILFHARDGVPAEQLPQVLAERGKLYFPFFKNLFFDLGPWYIALAVVVIVGTSNAVNLTDGLDGLAIGPSIMSAAAFFVLAYLGGNAIFSNYLQIPHVVGVGELAPFCAAIVGAGVAFLWFNTYPAQIFMGDVGALSLGGAIGALAVATKNEFLLVILGGIFVIETLSVILQVVSFKVRGKRIFRMAPIHHHFELMGWPEPKVIVRFWIVSFVFAVIALSTLKLR